jgi:5-methylcytosine-specific restriction endonuclease McrA
MTLILQLDSYGQPNKWITWQTAVTYHSKDLIAWSLGDVEMVIRGGDNRITGKQSIIKTSSIVAIKGEVGQKRRNKPPSLNNRELFRRDRHMCAYCGKIFKEAGLSRDHIIPASKGGPDTWMNCITCCGRCNQRKSDKTLEECGMSLLFVPYVPSRAEYLFLQNKNILFDQMEFLLSFIPEESRAREHIIENNEIILTEH